MKSHYLCGPMTGYPQFNFPLFDAATAWLRAAGWALVSPAELDEGPVREAALRSATGSRADIPAFTAYGEILGRDVSHLVDACRGIVLLPHWEKSQGARTEVFVGLTHGLDFVALGVMQDQTGAILGFQLLPVDRDAIKTALLENTP